MIRYYLKAIVVNDPLFTLLRSTVDVLLKEGHIHDNKLSYNFEDESQLLLWQEVKSKLIQTLDNFGLHLNFDLKTSAANNDVLQQDINADDTDINDQKSSVAINPLMDPAKKIRLFNGKTTKIKDLNTAGMKADIIGKIFNHDVRVTKTIVIYQIMITDFTNSILVKIFSKEKKSKLNDLKVGSWVSVNGTTIIDKYLKELVFHGNQIEEIKQPCLINDQNQIEPRAELHVHTKMSTMDGVSWPKEYLAAAEEMGLKAIAFTDHNSVQAFPDIATASQNHPNIKVIYGAEFNVFDDNVKYCINSNDQNLETSKYVFFDLETTGLNPETDEIIEFGAVITNGLYEVQESVSFFINPQRPVSKRASAVSKITMADLAGAPILQDKIDDIIDFFKDAIIVAHNADFD